MSGSVPTRREAMLAAVERLKAEPTQQNILAVLDAAEPVDTPAGSLKRWMGPRLHRFLGPNSRTQPGAPLAQLVAAVIAEARRRADAET
jgi:hypothetical protein